jgi:hypothetical protein
MINPQPGSIVSCPHRQWVVIPSDLPEVVRLRPLSGNEGEICGVFTPLGETITRAKFPLPNPDTLSNNQVIQLLFDAARLSLRSGAGPFRSLGRLSVRPRHDPPDVGFHPSTQPTLTEKNPKPFNPLTISFFSVKL